MDKISAMREKRGQLWEQTKTFLDAHTDGEGKLSAEDAAAYDKMEREVVDFGKDIERLERQAAIDAELAKPTSKAITNEPGKTGMEVKTGRASDEYRQAMLQALRTNFRQVSNVLQEGVDTNGGYLVPEEYDRRLIDVLRTQKLTP